MGEGKKGTFLMGFGFILCLLFWRGGGVDGRKLCTGWNLFIHKLSLIPYLYIIVLLIIIEFIFVCV